jgi:hypothetical protein
LFRGPHATLLTMQAALGALQGDVLAVHVPRYGGTTTSDGQEFVQVRGVRAHICIHTYTPCSLTIAHAPQMENLLAGFVDARVMDCKVGVR